ncbi:MAG: helix-turn-helix domain-containing protein [Candidatus Acidiferrales bacterium]
MQVGQRLREIREAKNLSQGDIEKRSGLLRPYISRVECGHTVPSLETIEKFARGLGIPTYQLFIGAEGNQNSILPATRGATGGNSFGKERMEEERYFLRLWRLLAQMSESNRALFLFLAVAMAKRKK